MSLGEQVEEQLPTGAIEWDKTKLVHDEQRCPLDMLMEPSQGTGIPSLEKIPHQIRCPDKDDPVPPTQNLDISQILQYNENGFKGGQGGRYRQSD